MLKTSGAIFQACLFIGGNSKGHTPAALGNVLATKSWLEIRILIPCLDWIRYLCVQLSHVVCERPMG